MRGAQDVDRVNLNRIDDSNSPQDRVVVDQFVVNFFAAFGQKLFRVVKPPMPEFFGENDRGGYDRAGEGAATGLINAGDCRDTKGAQSAFMPETTATIHLAILSGGWPNE